MASIDEIADKIKSIPIKATEQLKQMNMQMKGPQDEIVPFEARADWAWRRFGRFSDLGYFYVRSGDLIFLDDRLEGKIPGAEEPGENIIYLHKFKGEMQEPTILPYSALTIYAMQLVDFKGKNVLDLGSGAGVLSIVAKKMGASKVIAVDKSQHKKAIMFDHVLANDMNSDDFRYIRADICRDAFWTDISHVDIVLANIGPHSQYYSAHIAAIASLNHFSKAKVFIGGGYCIAENHPYLKPDEAVSELTKKGFGNYREVSLLFLYEGKPVTKLAFIVEKKEKGTA